MRVESHTKHHRPSKRENKDPKKEGWQKMKEKNKEVRGKKERTKNYIMSNFKIHLINLMKENETESTSSRILSNF